MLEYVIIQYTQVAHAILRAVVPGRVLRVQDGVPGRRLRRVRQGRAGQGHRHAQREGHHLRSKRHEKGE